jgi:hypothetical protein
LSWVLPYQKVADGVAGLLADKSNCPTFIQALVKHADRKRVWKVVENLKALSTEASRQLLRQLLTAMRTEYRPHWVAPYVLLVFPLIPIAIWIASFVNTPRTVPFGRGPDDMFYLGMVGFFVALLGLPSLITFCIALSGRAKLRRIAETETALRL